MSMLAGFLRAVCDLLLLYYLLLLPLLKSLFCGSSGLPKPDFSDLLDPFDTPVFNKLSRGTVPVQGDDVLNRHLWFNTAPKRVLLVLHALHCNGSRPFFGAT